MSNSAPQPADPLPRTANQPAHGARWWAALVLAGLGLALSGYLGFISLTGGQAAGCGDPVGGCGELLQSPWSRLGPVPVAGLAAGAYAVVLATLIVRRRLGGFILAAAATACGGAAVWFVYLQQFELGRWCAYCTAAHGVGLAMAVVLLSATSWRRHWPGVLVGLIGVAVLAGGQSLGREPSPSAAGKVEVVRDGRTLTLLDGRLTLDLDDAIVLGDPHNPRLLVEMFDYYCARCRAGHEQLNALREREGFTLVLVPVPLNVGCNPAMRGTPGAPPADACAIAKLAMIVHDLDPEAFEAFHNWASAGPVPTTAEARAYAGTLVDEVLVRLKTSDPAYHQTIRRHTAAWGDARTAGLVGGLPVFIAPDGGLVYGDLNDGTALRALVDTLPAAAPDPPPGP